MLTPATTPPNFVGRVPQQGILLSACALWLAALGIPLPAHAADTQVPWECSNYSEEAKARCMQALIETQRERIGQLEGELKAQRGAMGQLREQVDRQSAATADLQRQLANPPAVQTVPPMYAYPPAGIGIYPGIGLYFGRPWGYAYGSRPYLGFGYRYYWPCRRHWRGCW